MSIANKRVLIVAASALFFIVFTPIGLWLESMMTTHVLIEIPLLISIGVFFGHVSFPTIKRALILCNGGGVAGILIASFGLAFWMIPRWLDASLVDPLVAISKYASLVMLVGVPLAWSWHRLHPIGRGVVKIEFLAMLFRLGWLYLVSPNRLCNSYLLEDQIWLGRGFLVLALVLSITWLIPVFFDLRTKDNQRNSTNKSLQLKLR